MNLTALLDATAARLPQKAAIVDDATVVSYAQLAGLVEACAAQLRGLGLMPGARVGLCFPNSIDYVALTFALWRVGAVVVPLPTEFTAEELADIAATMALEAMLSHKASARSAPLTSTCFVTRLAPKEPADNHGLNLAFIRFTSGTTSARKGVALSHETIRDRVLAANKALKITEHDTIMWCLPMAHHFLITIVLYLSQGATIVLARHVLAKPFLDATHRWQGTVLYAAPFQLGLLARDKSDARLDSVRLAVSTTCALPEDVARDFLQRFDRPLCQALGIIELGLVSLNTDDPRGRWNSVGRPISDHRVKILHPDEQGVGEVAISGPGFFDAYAAPWVSREQAIPGGWFTTGDLGRIDADGFLFLLSRKTAVINLAGRKVFPEEIEAVLNRHPLVRESRVFGRMHPHLGEVVEADLVLAAPGADLTPLREFCRDHLSSYKIPSRLNVVTSLPRTASTGKIVRAAPAAQH